MRIITYNIRGGLGMDERRDTARIADFVLALSPDIVCFQEVHQRLPWSGWINQPRILAKRLKMRFVFQANVRLPWGGYGLGIATRLPIQHIKRYRLPGRGEPRGVLRVRIAASQGPLDVLCTHWGLDEKERTKLARWTQALAEVTHTPVIVCGDLNDVPEAGYVQSLLRQAGLADAGQAENAPTYPSDAPRARIDVVFCPAMWTVTRAFTVASPLSDHLPLVVDLDYGDGGGILDRAAWALK